MSTHQMHQVEELCDRLVLINQGNSVLYGPVDEIRRSYADRSVRFIVKGEVPPLAGCTETARKNGERTWALPKDMEPQQVLQHLMSATGVAVESFELAIPTMDDIFVKVVAEG